MRVQRTIKWMLFVTVAITSCYYDNEETLYPSGQCVVENMSYTNDISSIIKNNCLVCHNSVSLKGNIDLEGYDKLKKYVDNGGLLGSIKHQSGYSPMPQNTSKLTDCQISKIEQWITQGALNN
ncbi:MAG: hypothetical protein IPN29_15120 [Saprospiraceae bacterium]|nr:hypothetical protein [Saprospiraceae bacterium]